MLTLSGLRLLTVLLCCGLCAPIKVPVSWESEETSGSTEHGSVEDQGDDSDEDSRESVSKAPFEDWSPEQQKGGDEREQDNQNKDPFQEWAPEQYHSRDQRLKTFEQGRPNVENVKEKPVPVEYFEYQSKKPQFAVDIATFHGVPAPNQHFHSYPVLPQTERPAPLLGQHAIKQQQNPFFSPFQTFMNTHEGLTRYLGPTISNYEVFHPYKAEEPGLKSIYRDPHLEKVRHDVEENKKRLQHYEVEAGKDHIVKQDYKKSPEQTDKDLFGQSYKPTSFEEYRPEKRPRYYSAPTKQYLPHNHLNRKLKYPLNLNYIKIKPLHYQPLRNHLKKLKHQQEKLYGDERNEYPQVKPRHPQHFAEPPEGFDIYENGKKTFDDYRHDVDSALNQYDKDNGAHSSRDDESEDLTQNQEYKNEPQSEEDFVPIKMYAQVRKTHSTKHLPRQAAYEDAETADDILNAPRLREAVKSTKAHTIYSEEGYEDKAYDHEGQQKHASNHENHGGFLKEKEKSGGRYKIPFVVHDFEEGDGMAAGNSYTHKEKYRNDDGKSEAANDSENTSADEDENDENDYDLHEAGSETLQSNHRKEETPTSTLSLTKESERTTVVDENDGTSIKTEMEHMTATNNNHNSKTHSKNKNHPLKYHETTTSRKKRNTQFEIPKFSLDNTYLTEREILDISKHKIGPLKDNIQNKYPYYFENNINKNSPLRYAENLKFIPRKTKGGSEFYESTSGIECPDVEPEVDPIPESLNNLPNEENSDADDDNEKTLLIGDEKNKTTSSRKKRQADFTTLNKTPRLKGLGDKIDCFKTKYFGENPLDSPFFIEDIINDPEPVTQPSSDVFNIYSANNKPSAENNEVNEIFQKAKQANEHLVVRNEKEKSKQLEFTQNGNNLENTSRRNGLDDASVIQYPVSQSHVYSDIIHNIRNFLKQDSDKKNENIVPLLLSGAYKNGIAQSESNKHFKAFLKKEDVTIRPFSIRTKRSTQFVYEPYKVIRENQDQEPKKTTTSSNVSPLIRQLQSSKLLDQVIRPKDGLFKERKVQPVKRNVKDRTYKNIHREDRAKQNRPEEKNEDFVDVSVDGRRGEPRYERNKSNHKLTYTPIIDARSMSLEEYSLRARNEGTDKPKEEIIEEYIEEPTTTTKRPYFDVSSYIPKFKRPKQQDREIALESVNQPVKRKLINSQIKNGANSEEPSQETSITLTTEAPSRVRTRAPDTAAKDVHSNDEDEYTEYEDETEETTTTKRPLQIRRKIKIRTTTPIPAKSEDYDYEDEEISTTTSKPRIRKVKKLRKPLIDSVNKSENSTKKTDETVTKPKQTLITPRSNPKILETSLKSEKSTMVTDSKSYGKDEKGDMQKEQIDGMIGGQKSMDEFIADYDDAQSDEKSNEAEHLTQNDQDDSESDEDDDSETEEEEDIAEHRRQIDKEYDDNDSTQNGDHEDEGHSMDIIQPKTNIEVNLPVMRKIIKINKILPKVQLSPGHSSQYRESIDEEETIRKSPENMAPLHMYEDKNLANDVNKLAEKIDHRDRNRPHPDVEVFKEELRTSKGPRHGGNYRSAKIVEDLDEQEESEPRLHGGNLKASNRADYTSDGGGGGSGDRRRVSARKSAALLNILAQAVPVLTTTPKYILDPSKRMYYYVDS